MSTSQDARKSKHGLSRDIPDGVKRQIRQQCRHACVFCRTIPYHYDHFDPEFEDAIEHSVEGIALLCPNCHQEKTAGRLSNASVARARTRMQSAKAGDVAWTPRDRATGTVRILGTTFELCEAPGVSINGDTLLGFDREGPFDFDRGNDNWEISGAFCDGDGRAVLRFDRNEVIVSAGSWDVRLEGTDLTINSGPNQIVARLAFDAEAKEISLTRLRMAFANGITIDGTPERWTIQSSEGERHITFGKAKVRGAAINDSVFRVGDPHPLDRNIAVNVPAYGTWLDWLVGGAEELRRAIPAELSQPSERFAWLAPRAGNAVQFAWEVMKYSAHGWFSRALFEALVGDAGTREKLLKLGIVESEDSAPRSRVRLAAGARSVAVIGPRAIPPELQALETFSKGCSLVLSGEDVLSPYYRDRVHFDGIRELLVGPRRLAVDPDCPRLISSALRLSGDLDAALELTDLGIVARGRRSRLVAERALILHAMVRSDEAEAVALEAVVAAEREGVARRLEEATTILEYIRVTRLAQRAD